MLTCFSHIRFYETLWPGSSVHGILQARTLEWVSVHQHKGIYLFSLYTLKNPWNPGDTNLSSWMLSLRYSIPFGGNRSILILSFKVWLNFLDFLCRMTSLPKTEQEKKILKTQKLRNHEGAVLRGFVSRCHLVTSAKVVMIECLSELSAWLSTFLKLSILAFNLLFSHGNTKSPFLKLPRENGGEKCYLSSAPSKTLQDNRKTRIFLPLTPWPCKLMAFCCKHINKQGSMWASNPGSEVCAITRNSVQCSILTPNTLNGRARMPRSWPGNPTAIFSEQFIRKHTKTLK